jgi:CubicO group peptidase (beta-lactamase class C family)
MHDYFPRYNSVSLDPRKQDITVEPLLTVRMGIAGEAEDNYGVYAALYNSDNWIRSTIEWWLGQFSGQDSFMGYGYGGQFVIVFPELDLIVVTTAENNVPPETANTQEWAIFDLVNQYVLASLLQDTG